jgi:hypothetical protein
MWAMSAGKVTTAIGKHMRNSQFGRAGRARPCYTVCGDSGVFDFAVFMLLPWIE